jgi:hypothetical protein
MEDNEYDPAMVMIEYMIASADMHNWTFNTLHRLDLNSDDKEDIERILKDLDQVRSALTEMKEDYLNSRSKIKAELVKSLDLDYC